MYHIQRWTLDKIRARLELIAPLVYARAVELPAFRYLRLDGPLAAPPVAPQVNDSGWATIRPHDYWGAWMSDFVLRTTFTVPAGWDTSAPIALFLPLGEAGDFSHPEALAYIDGAPYAAADRHHQEILLRPEWADGRTHTLALHGWTGLGGFANGDPFTRLYMRPCQVVQIHQPTRDFIALARGGARNRRQPGRCQPRTPRTAQCTQRCLHRTRNPRPARRGLLRQRGAGDRRVEGRASQGRHAAGCDHSRHRPRAH